MSRRSRFELRLVAGALLAALPFAALSLALLLGYRPGLMEGAGWLGIAALLCVLALRRLRRVAAYPLRTVATLLEALREDDYLLRGRLDAPGDALGELVREVNLLRDTLHGQRVQVRETLALLRKIIETVDLAVLTFAADGRLGMANAFSRRLLGIGGGAETMPDQTAASLGVADLLEQTQPTVLEREFPGGSGRWEVRHRRFRENGAVHHLLVISDLTRALRAEEREAWQRLVRVLGHEINNSLAPIQSISESLQGRIDTANPEFEADLREGLAVVGARASALERFVKGYTQLARMPEPQPQPTEIGALARRVAALHGPRCQVMSEAPGWAMADPVQIEQLLINLLKNAVEASPPDGRVTLHWASEGPWLELCVDDNGPGLPQSDNLFVPFFTTKPEGSGIGLVLGRRIAEAHGGELALSNRDDGGCRARLRLPALAGAQATG